MSSVSSEREIAANKFAVTVLVISAVCYSIFGIVDVAEEKEKGKHKPKVWEMGRDISYFVVVLAVAGMLGVAGLKAIRLSEEAAAKAITATTA